LANGEQDIFLVQEIAAATISPAETARPRRRDSAETARMLAEASSMYDASALECAALHLCDTRALTRGEANTPVLRR